MLDGPTLPRIVIFEFGYVKIQSWEVMAESAARCECLNCVRMNIWNDKEVHLGKRENRNPPPTYGPAGIRVEHQRT